MSESGSSSRILAFAAFEFDTGTRELRKSGMLVKLSGQPLEVLGALIERPGEIVGREELQRRLWLGTNVDFENSLNAAMKRLRAALGDSADAPRFVETVARQGYRFIAPVGPARKLTAPPGVPEKPMRGRALLVLAAAAVLVIPLALWMRQTERFWRSPLAGAHFQTVTDFDGLEQAAAVSRDGKFLAFLSDRGGQMDVWVTQAGSGQFHNLTRGRVAELINPSIRTLGFSPDGSLVTFWRRQGEGAGGNSIGIWAAPTLGGEPRPYLEGAAELDWSGDGSRLAYHTPGPGDPLFVGTEARRGEDKAIFSAPAGMHGHFPTWAPGSAFLYFIQGALPDRLDIWRVAPTGGRAERITSQGGKVSHPVFLDRRTILYLAGGADGSGPWVYGMDVERRIPHRLTSGLDRYTSLAVSSGGRRLVATRASAKRTLWRLRLGGTPAGITAASRIPLTTSTAFSPRMGPDYLLYVSANSASESIWKLAGGIASELWNGPGAQVLGGPAVSPDGRWIAFSAAQSGRHLMYAMKADGTDLRIVSSTLELEGAPAWAPGEKSITTSARDHGTPRLFRVSLDGRPPAMLVHEYSVDPAWAPGGGLLVYTGADIGTRFVVKGVIAAGAARPLPAISLTRGARRLAFLRAGRELLFLRGEIEHKDLWLVDLETGAERQLTNLGPDFNIRDFDVSPDGTEVVLEQVRERSEVVLIDLPAR